MKCLLPLFIAACSQDFELSPDQGPCTNLEEPMCTRDSRCQQVYEHAGYQLEAYARHCARIHATPKTKLPCEALMFLECRARNDCSLLYWQDLGSNNALEGDPYFKACATEGSLLVVR
jgi:hypothetical protein